MINKIKILRKEFNLTQQELADKLGVSRQTINAIENNKYIPSLDLAFKLSGVFKKSIEEIFIVEND